MKTTNKRNDNQNSSRENVPNPYRNPHERIVRITEKWDGKTRVFYAIRDYSLGLWRGMSDLDEPDAWTRYLFKRAIFDTRAEARHELMEIEDWRREKAEYSRPRFAGHRGDGISPDPDGLDDIIANMRKMAAVA